MIESLSPSKFAIFFVTAITFALTLAESLPPLQPLLSNVSVLPERILDYEQCRTALRAVFLGTECRATLCCNPAFQS